MQRDNENRLDNLIALPYAKHLQWVAVGHTHMHIKDKSEAQIYGMLLEAKKSGRFFAKKLLQFFNGRKALTYTAHENNPLIISHLHMGKLNRSSSTIHYHFGFGNIPASITQDDMMTVFHELWVNKARESKKGIWLKQADTESTGWLHYGHNENKLGSTLGLDIHSTYIPNTLWQN